MRNIRSLCMTAAIVISTTSLAENLAIGTFFLPYRFEDADLSDIVRYVVTNDVQAYCSTISGFKSPYQDNNGHICVQRINAPAIIDRSELFKEGIKFYIENGQTNCVIRQSITGAAKAVASELVIRTNLVSEATRFVNSVLSGSITNRPAEEIRKAICYVRNGDLRHPTTQEADDETMRTFVASMNGKWVPMPLCHIELSRVSTASSTNTFAYLPLRGYTPASPSARHILTTDLVFIDGHWSICVDGSLMFR